MSEHGDRSRRAPAEGERAAVTGYSVQYRTTAGLILGALRDESLEWIALADPDAGTLDDFQLARRGRLDAYQVKFSGTAGSLTYARLRSLISELADAWDRLRKTNPERELFAHLHTSQQPSRHRSVSPLGDPPPSPKHFAGFLDAVWLPVERGDIRATTGIPAGWLPAWEELRNRTPFGKREFLNFVRHLKLDLGQSVPDVDAADVRVDPDLRRRYQELLWEIERIVTDPQRTVRMSRADLLQSLGWADEFEFRSVHEFAIRRDRFAPNAESTGDLRAVLDAVDGGYVALVGTPGSGKSTLLTDAFYGHPDVVARYYAYVPDHEVGRTTRASATNFLHDLVLSIERAGFTVGETPVGFQVEVLKERLRRQLRELGARFAASGQHSYIVIDGLDHVERVLRPGSSRETLLDHLPDPDEIPAGVFLILGTQRVDFLPEPVRTALRGPGRVVEIKPLLRADVLRLARESGVVPTGMEETVFTVSNGHPLIVAYVLAGLEGIEEAAREEWLGQLPRVDGDVLALYRSYWSDVENDDASVELVAYIARWRGAIDLEWFAAWLDPTAIRRLRRTAAHFFRKESARRWYFFHESFRVFLLEQTIQAGDGTADDRIALRYHSQLAERCAASSEERIRWEQLHHLIEAGDEAGALGLAQPAEFRSQALALRALPAIRVDIQEATRVAIRRRDLRALARLTLAAHELGQRQYHLEWSENLALLLIELGEEEIALEHLRGDFALRESKNVALRAALLLLDHGFEVEARRLFDLAEPLDLLRGEPEHYFRADAEVATLFAWAEVAPSFRSLASVGETIRGLPDESFGHRGREDRDLARYYRAQLLAVAGIGGLYAGHAEEVETLLEQFDLGDSEQATAWTRLVLHRFRTERPETASARERLNAALGRLHPDRLANWIRLRVAEQLYHLGDVEGSRHWLSLVDPPSAPEPGGADDGARPFMSLLRFQRLSAALGSPLDPETISEARNSHYRLFSRGIAAIAHLGNLWGTALAGEMAADEFLSGVNELISALDRRAGRDDLGWYAIEAARPELLSLVVHAAAAAGTDTLEKVRAQFLERWQTKSPPSDDEIRRVLQAFLDTGSHEQWIGEELERYEPEMLRNKDVTGQIDACFAQARAWLALNRRDKAMEVTLLGVARSSGVGFRKDYQLNTWIELMGPLLRETDQEAEVQWLARVLARLDESTEGRASALATEELLRQTAGAHPRTAVRVLRTLPALGVLSDWQALAAFLEGLAAAPEEPLAWLSLSEVLVATAHRAQAGSIRALAEATGDESLRTWLQTISTRVAVHALPTTRLYWRRALARIAEEQGWTHESVGLDALDLEPSERAPRSYREEPSGSGGSPADDVTTPADLFRVLSGPGGVDYHLRAAVERVADQLDRDEVIRAAEALRRTDYAPLVLARLARRLAALGYPATARAYADEAIAAGGPSGWVPYIDGGTRIRPLEALAAVDASAARERLWELLERDAEDGGFNPAGLADSFEVLVAIGDDAQALSIAGDVRDHIRNLLSAVSEIDELASADDVTAADVPAACAALLVDALRDGDAIRADAGARACVHAISAQFEPLPQQVALAAREGGEASRRAVHVLAAAALLSGSGEHALPALRETVESTQASEDDRQIAQALLAELRETERPDIGRVGEGEVSLLGLLERPVQRPAEVTGGSPPRDELRTEDWLAGLANAPDTVPTRVGDGVIIGEFMSLTRLEWELPHENREQAVMPASSDQRARIPFLMDIPMRRYHALGEIEELADELHDALVFTFTEPGDYPWSSLGVALNPIVAGQLGWRPSDGLLAWEDGSGGRTCWSIWWRDGHREHKPPSFDDLVGEGWLVVATPEALRQLEEKFGPLERFVEVRRYSSSGHRAVSARRAVTA